MTTTTTTTETTRTTRTVTQEARSGRITTVETSLTLPEALDVLRTIKGNDFAANLLRWAAGGLSASNYNWALICAQQELDRRNGVARQAAAPVARPNIGNMSAIYTLFQTAGKALKRPKIKIETATGQPVVLGVAGSGSRYSGSITVTTGEPFGTPGAFFGYIHADGTATVRDQAVLDVLVKFAADPAGVAAQYGRTHDSCCFCRRPLSNGEAGSVSVGYGPICAGNYGLPWVPNKANGFEATQGNALTVLTA